MDSEQVELGFLEVVRRRVLHPTKRKTQKQKQRKAKEVVSSDSSLFDWEGRTHLNHLTQPLQHLLSPLGLPVDSESKREGDPVSSFVGTKLEEGDSVGEVKRVVSEVKGEGRVVAEDLKGVL